MQQRKSQRIIWIVWILGYLISTNCYRFEPNTFIYRNHSECSGSEKNPVHANYTVVPMTRNKFDVNGEFILEEYLGGQIDVQIITERCDFNLTQCEFFDSFNVHDICRLLDLTDKLWSEFMRGLKNLRCPFKKATYKMTHSVIDAGYFAHMPMNGYSWTVTVKCYQFDQNTLALNNFSTCIKGEDRPINMTYSVTQVARNRYIFNGYAIFMESLPGPLELYIFPERCNFNKTQCEMLDALRIPDICKVLDLENQLWSEFMKHIHPKLSCPFKKNISHIVSNAPVNAGLLSNLPLEGYTWTFTEKMFKSVKGKRIKRMVYCEAFEITITSNRQRRKMN